MGIFRGYFTCCTLFSPNVPKWISDDQKIYLQILIIYCQSVILEPARMPIVTLFNVEKSQKTWGFQP